jgi:hypothetical protein
VLPDGSEGGDLEALPSVEPTGFRIRYRFSEPGCGLAFLLPPALVEEGVTVISGDRWSRRYEDFADEPAQALLFGVGTQLQIRFDPPLRLTVRSGAEGLRCVGLLDPGLQADSLDVVIQTSFDEERNTAQRLLNDAANARRDGRLGEAIFLLQRIVDEFPYSARIVDEAKAPLEELTREAEAVVAGLREIREETGFFDTEARWRRLATRCGDLARRYAGSRFGETIEQLSIEAAEAADRIHGERRREEGTLLLRRGEDLVAAGDAEIARVVLGEVVREYPESELAARAEAVLRELGDR